MPARNATPKKKSVQSKSNVKVHAAVELDANNPVPIDYGGNAFTATSGAQYYPFIGQQDNLFRTLLEIRLLSPTQSNCINDKVFYSVGAGLQVKDQDFPTAFDKKMNGKRQTIDDILKAVFESLYQDGNKFIEIARTEVGGEKFVYVYPHNNMDCRLEQPEDGGDPTHVIRSKEFRRNSVWTWTKDAKPIKIPLWTDDALKKGKIWMKDGRVERTMLHIKNEVQGIDHYGLPTNYAGILQALLEYKAARFNLDNFENNMFLGGMLMIQGNLSDPEEKKIVQKIRKMHTGDGKRQRILPISSEGGITDSKFVPFNEQKDGHFMDFDKHNEDKIIGANGWSRALLDMHASGSIGKGGEYLKNLFKIKFQTVINPAQQIVLNNFIFPLMQIIDEYKNERFYDLPWTIQPVIPIGLDAILDVNSLLTVDEGRQEIGRQPLEDKEKGKKLISEVKAKAAPAPGNDPNTKEEEVQP